MNRSDQWLSRFLFCHMPRQTTPDGRPLYAYKCRECDYEELKELARTLIRHKQTGEPASNFPQIFCLYAAETFRREHAEGAWSWDAVFNPIGMETPDQPRIGEWIETGLKWWQRPLLYDRNGKRRFLVTIACEGGLPLRLLQQDSAKLTQFFIASLEDYHRSSVRDRNTAETCARNQAFKLPPTLCQDVVFLLGGDLIAKIVELQEEIGDTFDPIAALDQKKPHWRRELPLNAEDQTVEVLLRRLVGRSGELTRAATTGLRWRGWLKSSEQGFVVEKDLELPDTLSTAQIKECIDEKLHELAPRLRVLLHTPHGIKPIARLTLVGGAGDDAVFRREWLQRDGVILRGPDVFENLRLLLHDGRNEEEISIRGGEPWDELPWVFVARNGSDRLEWWAEGSARTRAEQAWVTAAHDNTPHPSEGAVCEKLGEIAELGRNVYRITGSVDFITPDQDRYRIQCRAETDSAGQYVVRGKTVTDALNNAPVYRGLPCIEAVDGEGHRLLKWRAIPQWKPVGIPSEWKSSSHEGSGRLWLRCLGRDNPIELFRRQVDVLPRQFGIERTIGQTTVPGSYRLHGLTNAKVRVISPPEAQPTSCEDSDSIRIECPILPIGVLPVLRLEVICNGGSQVELQLPYPQRGAAFRLGGQTLAQGDRIPLDRFGGLRLSVQDHSSGRFWLDAQIIPNAAESNQAKGSFRTRLPPLENGRLDRGLYEWHDRIASLLASGPDLDACVRLEVTSSHQDVLVSLDVARFDVALEPDRTQGYIRIPDDSLKRLEPDWENRIRVEMIRLWAPGEIPRKLSVHPKHPTTWIIPSQLEAGPWWIIGREGGWARFRPVLWTVEADGSVGAEMGHGALAYVVRATRQEREALFPVVLEELGNDPNHDDWPLMFDYFKLTREFPPSALDVLKQLTQHPSTLAMALLKADEESFERVWAYAESMPFSWGLVPVRDWEHAATRYFQGLLAALAGMETGGELVSGFFQSFRERTTARRAYWRPLCDWLQERIFPDRSAPLNSELRMARLAKACVESQIGCAEQELQGRHDAEETWPESPMVMECTQEAGFRWAGRYGRLSYPFQAVRYAPFVVAHISLNGIKTERALIYELRLLRHFDPEWFDTAYAIALTLGLSDLPPERAR